jgi:hypothetical protein
MAQIIMLILFFILLSGINAVAADQKDLTVFGVTLGKSFAASGVRECKHNPPPAKGYDSDCYEHNAYSVGPCSTYLQKDFSFPMVIRVTNKKECDMESPVEVLQGEFLTQYCQKILSMVVGKFGNPHSTENKVVSNAMGAKFNKVENRWNINGNTIYLTNMYGQIDEGVLIITHAERVKRNINKTIKYNQSDQQKF